MVPEGVDFLELDKHYNDVHEFDFNATNGWGSPDLPKRPKAPSFAIDARVTRSKTRANDNKENAVKVLTAEERRKRNDALRAKIMKAESQVVGIPIVKPFRSRSLSRAAPTTRSSSVTRTGAPPAKAAPPARPIIQSRLRSSSLSRPAGPPNTRSSSVTRTHVPVKPVVVQPRTRAASVTRVSTVTQPKPALQQAQRPHSSVSVTSAQKPPVPIRRLSTATPKTPANAPIPSKPVGSTVPKVSATSTAPADKAATSNASNPAVLKSTSAKTKAPALNTGLKPPASNPSAPLNSSVPSSSKNPTNSVKKPIPVFVKPAGSTARSNFIPTTQPTRRRSYMAPTESSRRRSMSVAPN